MRLKLLILLLVFLAVGAEAAAPQRVGWRTDGTGKYPQADPPIEWSAEKAVLWSTPMPGWSNATPVLVGGKIFVCSEPSTLICVDAADGRILWQKTPAYADVLSPEEAAQAEKDTKQAQQLQAKIDPLSKKFEELRNQLRKTPKDAELRKRAKAVRKQVDELKAALKPLSKWRLPSTHDVNGYSSCTPTSDGESVYVLFGTGVAACYDMAGNRKWIKFIEKPTDGYGHSASPLLVGDKLLVQVLRLVALNKDTGEEVWSAKARPRWGSPVHTTLGGVGVAITADGDVIRISDGKVLVRGLAALEYCAPVVHEGTAFFIEHGGKAVRLPAQAAEKIEKDALWQTRPKKDRYYASPVCHQGLIYAVTQTGLLSAIDAGTGEIVYEQKLELGKGTVYPSVTLAGEYLFVSSDNGTTIVFQPGREFKQIAKNTLEPFRSSPVFSGSRLYIRGRKSLYCIGK